MAPGPILCIDLQNISGKGLQGQNGSYKVDYLLYLAAEEIHSRNSEVPTSDLKARKEHNTLSSMCEAYAEFT